MCWSIPTANGEVSSLPPGGGRFHRDGPNELDHCGEFELLCDVAHLEDTPRCFGKIVSGDRPPRARRSVDPVEAKGLVLFAPEAEPIERGGSFGSRNPHIGAADDAADRRQAVVGQHASRGRQRIRLEERLE